MNKEYRDLIVLIILGVLYITAMWTIAERLNTLEDRLDILEDKFDVLDESYAEFWSEYIQFKEVTNDNVIYFCEQLEDCSTSAIEEPLGSEENLTRTVYNGS